MAEVVKGIIDVEINTGSAAAELKILQQQINSVFLTLNKNNATSAAASQKFASNLLDAVNASRVFTGEQVKMRTAASALDDTLKKGQATLGQYFSAKYVKNGALFAETLDLSRKRAALLQTQFIATGAASKGMQDAIAIRPLQAFSTQAAIAAQRTQILSSMFRQGTTQLINFGKNVQWAGRQLMVGFTVPLTIFGTTAGRVFKDLEKEVVAFKKVYGDLFTTPAELNQNLEAVKELSKEFTKYGVAVKDTMNLAAQAAAAGRRNSELTDAVTQATRLATLGQMEQNQALETTIALQSAFKLSGQELADSINFLNMVENQTVVSLQDLSAAIPRVAPVIQGLGGDVKDLSVFLAAMQEGGVSAEQGANALKSGLASLINPTKNATETLAGFGVNLDNIIKTNRGDLMGVVMDFGRALQTLDEFSRQQALEEVFGKFQYARLGALFENIVRDGSQASQVMQTMGYTTQELASTAEKELKTVADSFGVQLQGAIERFKLAIAPIGELFVKLAIPIVNFVTRIAEAFNNLPDFAKTFTAFAAIITGLVIPAGTMFFGLLMNLTGTLAKLVQFMGAFGKGFTQGGIIGAFKNATQSAKYFSNSEIEAALAAQQLGTAAEYTNSALREQITQAMGAAGAVGYLSDSYTILVAKMMEASKLAPYTMGVGERASDLAKSGRSASGRLIRPPQMRNAGGRIFMSDGSTVPGTGNTDTVPAMLTPGEFVVNKQATKENLGLLYAINGGGAGFNKGGILNAVKGKYITPADAARTSQEELSVFLLKNMSKAKRTIAAKAAPGEILNKLNNFVYLFEPNTNQQLIGSKTMKGYDKRGVPGNQLINEMLTDDALWMIDAYAQGKWAKAAYKQTLQDNYNNLISKYPGKEIRFVDHKGLERVKSLSGTPGYENVQFLSVRQLHDKNLYNRLSPDHLTRLLSLDTANQMQSRLRSSTGKIEPRSTYVDINSGSYTKLQKSWRGTKRPAGKQGSHFNTGGLLMANNGAFVSKNFAYDTTALSGADAKAFNTKMNQLYDYFRKNNIDRSSLPLYMQSDHVPLNSSHAKEFLQFLVKNKVPTGQFADVYSFLMNAIKNPSVYHRRILEGFMTSEIGHLTKSKNIKYGEAEKTSRKNLFSALSVTGPRITNMEDALFALENLDSFTASEFLSKRIRQGKIVKVPLGRGYGEAKRSAAGIPIRGRVRLHATTPSQITRILGVTRNKGGIIPGVNYLNMGGIGKAIFERSKVGKPRIKNLSGLDANSMNLIDELVPFIGADAAVDYAKILQKGHINVDIGEYFKKAASLEDIVQDRFREWKSQNQWAVYSPGYQDVRDRALSKIRKQVTDQEFKRISTGRPSLIEDYNKNLDNILGLNKGGMAPGGAVTLGRNFYGRTSAMIMDKFNQGLYHAGNITGDIKARGTGSRGSGFYTTESQQSVKIFRDNFNTPMLYKLGFSDEQIRLIQDGKTKTYNHSNPVHRKRLAEQLGIKTDAIPDINDEFLFESIRKDALKRLGYDVGVFPLENYKLPKGMKNNFELGSNEIVFYTKKLLPSKVTPQKFNQGNIVPGVGNTDTVPAMLTPGEFVVNKEATANNLALLKAINNGSMAGYNMGGKIPGVQYFGTKEKPRVVKETKESFFQKNPMAQMGLMSAGFMLPMIGQQMQESTNKFSKGIGDFIGFLTPALIMLSIFPNKIGGLIAVITTVGVAMYKVGEKLKDIQKSGNEFAKAMYGSAESTKKFSETFNRQTSSQRLATRMAEAGGGSLSDQAKQVAQEFIKSDLGKQLVKDIQTVANAGGDTTQALLNQLSRQVVGGVITADEAKAISAQIAEATGNARLGFNVSARIEKIYDQNGKLIPENVIALASTITPKIDEQSIQAQVDRLYKSKTYSGLGKLIGSIDSDTAQKNKIAMGLIQQTAVETANIERESRATVRLAFLEGQIAIEQYNQALKDLNEKDATGLVFQRSVDLLIKQKGLTEEIINTTKRGAGSAINPFGSPRGDIKIESLNPFSFIEGKFDKQKNQTQDIQDFYNDYTKSFIEFNKSIGVPKSVMDENLDFAEKFGSNLIESARILSDIMSGDLGLGTLQSLKSLSEEQVIALKASFQSGKMDQEEFLDLLNQLESYPELQEKILKLTVEDGEGAVQMTKDALDVLNTIDSLPADIRANIKLDTTDLEAVLGYKDEANSIKQTYDQVSDYIKRTKDDISKKDIQQRIIAKFAPAGTDSKSLWNYITDGGKKELDPLKLPILLSLQYDPQIKRLMDIAAGRLPGTTPDAAAKASKQLSEMFAGLTLPSLDGITGGAGGTGEKSQIQLMEEAAEAAKKYAKALKILAADGKLSVEQLSEMDEALAIEISNKGRKERIRLEQVYKDMLERRKNFTYQLMTEEEKELKRMDLQDKIYSRQIQLIERRIDVKQKDIEAENEGNEKRQRALNEISKREDKVNEAYQVRITALDDIDRATQRNANRERSRIDLASALASGDIAAAARTASQINEQESQYKIEDARTALEKQRQAETAAIAVEVNGIMMTRAQIEDAIALSDEKIYGIQQQIKKIEEEKIPIMKLQQDMADKRYATELNILETMIKQMDQAGTLSTTTTPTSSAGGGGGGGQTPTKPTPTPTPGPGPNKVVLTPLNKNQVINKNIPGVTYGNIYGSGTGSYTNKNVPRASTAKPITANPYARGVPATYRPYSPRYFGGLMTKGSKESPPALKMAYGNIVPGMGNSDKVPALLTPGEFVIRKSVASAYMPLLETLNNQTYPGAMPRGSAQNSSNMYNTYSVNVNVAGTDASPEEIANAVMSKIKAVESRSLRSVKVV